MSCRQLGLTLVGPDATAPGLTSTLRLDNYPPIPGWRVPDSTQCLFTVPLEHNGQPVHAWFWVDATAPGYLPWSWRAPYDVVDLPPAFQLPDATLEPIVLVPPSPPPLQFGRERGNFLYGNFFGPACVAFDPARRAAYFRWCVSQGHRHVVINAQQDDWGQEPGNKPEWTAGGCDVYANPQPVIDTLIEARRAGLSPVVGLLDQRYWRNVFGRDPVQAGRAMQRVIPLLEEHASAYLVMWEADEVSSDNDQHTLSDHVAAVTGREFGWHFGAGVWAGTTNEIAYWRRSKAGVLWYQYGFDADDATLASRTAGLVQRMHSVGKRFVAYEHSIDPPHTSADAARRAGICLANGADGSLNG